MDKDLATLREAVQYADGSGLVPVWELANDALARVEAELSRLEEERRHLSVNESAYYDQWKAAEAELSRLREERDALLAKLDRYQTDDSPHNKERPRDVEAPGATT